MSKNDTKKMNLSEASTSKKMSAESFVSQYNDEQHQTMGVSFDTSLCTSLKFIARSYKKYV